MFSSFSKTKKHNEMETAVRMCFSSWSHLQYKVNWRLFPLIWSTLPFNGGFSGNSRGNLKGKVSRLLQWDGKGGLFKNKYQLNAFNKMNRDFPQPSFLQLDLFLGSYSYNCCFGFVARTCSPRKYEVKRLSKPWSRWLTPSLGFLFFYNLLTSGGDQHLLAVPWLCLLGLHFCFLLWLRAHEHAPTNEIFLCLWQDSPKRAQSPFLGNAAAVQYCSVTGAVKKIAGY